jgi:hypothetical protein
VIVVPNNVLTLLSLSTGLFYAQGVKAYMLLLEKKPPEI